MTAAAARKKQIAEPSEPAESIEPRNPRLWIDESLLPTTLARKGLSTDVKEEHRLLTMGDLLIEATALVERRKKIVQFKGKERRLAR